MTDRELCVSSAAGSDYAGGASGLGLQGESIHLASAEERSCWPARNQVPLTGTSDFRDIYLNRFSEKVKQYLWGCVPVDEK